MRDMSRVINGLSLVAREFVRHSGPREGPLDALQSLAKITANVLGLTKGKAQVYHHEGQFAKSGLASKHKTSSATEDSVVYFNDSDKSGSGSSSASREEVLSTSETTAIDGPITAFSSDESFSQPASGFLDQPHSSEHVRSNVVADEVMDVGEAQNANTVTSVSVTATPSKRRKPRERKVPATPFTRALGSVSPPFFYLCHLIMIILILSLFIILECFCTLF